MFMSEREKERSGRTGRGDEGRQESRGARPAELEGGGGGGASVQRQPLGCSCGLTARGAGAGPARRCAGSDGEAVGVLCFPCNYN